MITKRDVILVGATAIVMSLPLAIMAHKYYQSNMPSTAFDWNNIKATPTSKGEKRQFFRSPTTTLQELELHVTTLNAGETSHPPHKHPEEELIIVKEGTVEALVNGEMKTVGPGSVIFQASGQLHSIKNAGTTPASYHAIQWKSK